MVVVACTLGLVTSVLDEVSFNVLCLVSVRTVGFLVDTLDDPTPDCLGALALSVGVDTFLLETETLALFVLETGLC